MSDYQYKASVIVPVYNVEKYLNKCIDSLINQTVEFSDIEVLLINDGSPDGSETICREYAEKYANIKLFSKENEGLSRTRNFGLRKASGKYIFYLDSDDSLAPETIKEVTGFFDTVYDEVDLLTYRITQYYEGRPAVVHFRYRTLMKSGVYDLNDIANAYVTQTNINICVKNQFENNITFDTTENFRHEDEKYCCDILSEKMKIGYCNKGEYIYNRENTGSIVFSQFLPEKIFDTSMDFYEELFSRFPRKVPPYFQGIVFNDLRWKLMDGKLLPAHLTGNEWKNAASRICNLIKRVDEDIIVLHPSVTENDMHFWLNVKPDSHPIAIADNGEITVFSAGRKLCTAKKILSTVKDNNGEKQITLKSSVFYHLSASRIKIFNGKVPIEFKKAEHLSDFPCDTTEVFMPTFTLPSDDVLNLKALIDSVEINIL